MKKNPANGAAGCSPYSAGKRMEDERTRSVMLDDEGNTSGRNERLRGHIGVRTSADNDGWTIGPPALKE